MKDTINKIKQVVLRSGLAESVDAQPTDDKNAIRVRIILKHQEPEKGKEAVHPVQAVTEMLAKEQVKVREISYFPAAKAACVNVVIEAPAEEEKPAGQGKGKDA
ncbi:MAG: hypothetical protein HQ559_10720 [Lentisphaerae bacterium]|nr:hypothetical protein [Lentisphaerota bacterium]